MYKLAEIIKNVRCGIYLTINSHKDYYKTTQQALDSYVHLEDVPSEVREGILKEDRIVVFQVYPRTPVGSYQIAHYDLEVAISEMYDNLVEDGTIKNERTI